MKCPLAWMIFCLAAIFLILPQANVCVAEQEEGTTDIVFALDVSGSMQHKNNFDKVCKALVEFIEKDVDLGAYVVLVTFGSEAKLIAKQQMTSDQDKAVLIKHISKLTAASNATYMTAGIDLSYQTLRSLATEHPNRSRVLVLLTDGQNQLPVTLDAGKAITFDRLRNQYAQAADFKGGKDWFLWYCYIGRPNTESREFAKSQGGQIIPIEEMRFLKASFNRVLIKLGDVPAGDWTLTFPPDNERKLGEKLLAMTRTPAEFDLELSDVILDGPVRHGESITVSPRTIRMNQAEQSVVLTLQAQGITAGERRGRIVVRSPRKLVFVKPQQFHVTFRAVAPGITIAPRDGVRFGRLEPGQAAERTFEIIPNEAAQKFLADKTIQLLLPENLPKGVMLAAQPATVKLGGPTSIRLKMSIANDAVLPPAGFQSALGFTGPKRLTFTPKQLPISFSAAKPKAPEITVIPSKSIDFGTVLPGVKTVREISLVPNEDAKATAPTITITAKTTLPKGISLKVEPEKLIVRIKTTIHLTLQSEATKSNLKSLTGKIVLQSGDNTVKLSSKNITWNAKFESSVIDVTPNDKIDFGALETGQSKTQLGTTTATRPAAAAARPVVRLSADNLPTQTTVKFDPQTVTLDRKQEVKVTLVAGPKTGNHEINLKLACKSPGIQLATDEMPGAYTAEAKEIIIDADKLNFGKIMPNDDTLELRVRVTASVGRIGEIVGLTWSFDQPPGNMSIVPSPQRITIRQKSEDVVFSIALKNAAPGKYAGTVKFRADSTVRPTALQALVEVVQPTIELVTAPDLWSISLPTMRPQRRATLPLTLRANRHADGVTVSIVLAGEKVEGISIVAEPQSLKLTAGENTINLSADAALSPSLTGQSYTGEIRVTTDQPHAAISPAAVKWRVVVPPIWPYAAIAAAVVGLVLILLFRSLWPRIVTCTITINSTGRGQVIADGAPYETGEAIELKARRISIGTGEDCAVVLANADGEPEPGGDWIVCLGRRRKPYLKCSQTSVQTICVHRSMDESVESVGAGSCVMLEHGDTITIDKVNLVFEYL